MRLDGLLMPAGKMAERYSYMENLSEAEIEQTDLVLAPLNESEDPDSFVDSWQLPCHSLILSSNSAVFSASKRHASCMQTEKNGEGKRVIRLPLSETAAGVLLHYCYGVMSDVDFNLLEDEQVIELAKISNMKALPGESYSHSEAYCSLMSE